MGISQDSPVSWQISDQGLGTCVVTGPDGAYEVTAHYEHSQSPVPEDGVRIDRITSGGRVLHDGRRIMPGCSFDAQVTELVEDAVLTAAGF